ncbi:hypothetical protein [Allomeiothermus silvanus]|uniref:hypothetical protein n=1 Tax=Allomeiothermus silvanus TaxID=52022 RepID=UPI0023F2A724|nr:hypothetical protein [Allomeiothermus silvanus]
MAWYPLARWLPVRLLPFVLLLAASSTEARHLLGDTLHALTAQSTCIQRCSQASSPAPSAFAPPLALPYSIGAVPPPALVLLRPKAAGNGIRLEGGSRIPLQQICQLSPRAPPIPT